jgi:hypothetical protein
VQAEVFPALLNAYVSAEASEDVQQKAQKSLKSVLTQCTHLPALEPLLHTAPDTVVRLHVSASIVFPFLFFAFFFLVFLSTLNHGGFACFIVGNHMN